MTSTLVCSGVMADSQRLRVATCEWEGQGGVSYERIYHVIGRATAERSATEQI